MLRSVYKTLGAGDNDLIWKVGSEPLFLIGVNLEVQDSSGNSVNNIAGNIWVQTVAGRSDDSISLAVGLARTGQIAGYGCLPLYPGQEIKGQLYHCTANDIGKLNVYAIPQKDMKSGSPAWTPRTDAIPMYHQGVQKIKNFTGAAAGTAVDIRPDAGYIWEIIELAGYHDDSGGNQDLWFMYYDGTNWFYKYPKTNVAANVRVYFPHADQGTEAYNSMTAPLTITRDVYLKLGAGAMGAGKKLYANSVVREYTI